MWKFKTRFDGIMFEMKSKKERWRLVLMNNRWKFHCRVADNKACRAVQILYVNYKLKAEFLL